MDFVGAGLSKKETSTFVAWLNGLNKTLGRGKNSAWIGGVTVAQEQVC
jgi:hypothetical protein